MPHATFWLIFLYDFCNSSEYTIASPFPHLEVASCSFLSLILPSWELHRSCTWKWHIAEPSVPVQTCLGLLIEFREARNYGNFLLTCSRDLTHLFTAQSLVHSLWMCHRIRNRQMLAQESGTRKKRLKIRGNASSIRNKAQCF